MKRYSIISTFCIALASIIMPGCGSDPATATQGNLTMNATTTNFAQATPRKWTAGQPSEAELQQLANQGLTNVINLRPESEWPFDEAKVAAAAGLRYHHIPVDGAAGITAENASKLQQLLSSLEQEPTLVHCASGNRVGALVALGEAIHNQKDLDTAISVGKRWGLKSLEPLVVEKISAFKGD